MRLISTWLLALLALPPVATVSADPDRDIRRDGDSTHRGPRSVRRVSRGRSKLWERQGINGTGTSSADGMSSAKAAIDALNLGFYNSTAGRWDTTVAWWVSGVALTAVIEYMNKTGPTDELMDLVTTVIEKQREPLAWWPEGDGDFRADSTDDTGWWALAMVRMYDLTEDREYLDIAIEDEAYIYQYWNASLCGGGVIQEIPELSYKNAISNELYIQLTAALHNRIPGDTFYYTRAYTAWSWFTDSGMINAQSLVNDGLTDTCVNNGMTTWTYNQGVILGGLVELWHATGTASFLTQAQAIADATLASPVLSPGGILTDVCEADESCDNNQQVFKGIFARNLMMLDAALGGDTAYRQYLVTNAQAAFRSDRNATDFYDVKWAGPFINSTLSKQTSAVALLVSLL